MKKTIKTILSGILATVLAFTAVGCQKTNMVASKRAGFELPHDSGFVSNEEGEISVYDQTLYRINEARYYGGDPGIMYVSEEECIDTYSKLKAHYSQYATFDLSAFEEKYGTQEEWTAKYVHKFYCAHTGATTLIQDSTKAKYPEVDYAFSGYIFYESEDMVNWKPVKTLDGYAVMYDTKDWNYNFAIWAPEMKRDPLSGLYMIVGSARSKSGNETTEYGKETTTSQWDLMQLQIVWSETPDGPYRTISADDYYIHLAKLNADGTPYTEVREYKGKLCEVAFYRDGLGHDGEILCPMNTATAIERKLSGNGASIFLNNNFNQVTTNTPPLNFGYYIDEIAQRFVNPNSEGRGIWPCIDADILIDSKGEMYMYFSQHISTYNSTNNIYVIHLTDWVTPDWDTLTHVTTPIYNTVYNTKDTALGGVKGGINDAEGTINEGAFVVEYQGWYYLTYAPFGTGSLDYSVYWAISDNPYGPFVKVFDYSPALGRDKADGGDYMTCTGHVSFCWVEGELWCVYHCFANPDNKKDSSGNGLDRSIGCDKVVFTDYDQLKWKDIKDKCIDNDIHNVSRQAADLYNLTEEQRSSIIHEAFETANGSDYNIEKTEEDIIPIMYGNGPTYSLQPRVTVALPDGLHDVALDDDCTIEVVKGNKDTAKYANDEIVTYQQWSEQYEVSGEKELVIKISWKSPKTLRNIMIYNSRNYELAFKKVDSILFELASRPTWYDGKLPYNGYCYIKDLEVDPYSWSDLKMRKGGSAIATFDPIEVKSVTVTILAEDKVDPGYVEGMSTQDTIQVSEIYVMGK